LSEQEEKQQARREKLLPRKEEWNAASRLFWTPDIHFPERKKHKIDRGLENLEEKMYVYVLGEGEYS